MLKKNRMYLLALFLLSILPLLDFFHPGLPVTHDGQDHVARIANFYRNLQEGVFIPRWAANLNWGFGHPILMFLYPLPSYIASLFHILGFNLIDSTKLVFIASYILSGLTMYVWLKSFLPRHSAFVGGLLYVIAPYRFVDIYVRGDIGESVAFVFPPLLFYFLVKMSQKRSYWYFAGGALTLAALILAHNAVSIIFLPVIFFYLLYLFLINRFRKYFILNILLLILTGFMLSAFFWVPAFFEGKYTLRDIITKGSYLHNFVGYLQLVYGAWSYGGSGQFSVQVGVVQWVMTIMAGIFIFEKNEKEYKRFLYGGFFIFFLCALFLMIPYSQFIWDRVSLLQKFQFPWRFLSLCVFVTALFGAWIVSFIPKQHQTSAVIIILVSLLFFNKDYWHARTFLHKPELFFTGIYNSTTDTGESAPIWSVRFMEHQPRAHIEVISGKVDVIQEAAHTSVFHSYVISTSSKIRLRENTLYFPGWSVTVDGIKVPIQFQDPQNRGVDTFFVAPGKHIVKLSFVETRLRLIADGISTVGLCLLAIFFILKKKLWLA